ncbi:MarR family winged helix-turn-helix transcriptional regulator [Paraglaciecola sp.]|uniref:MarR family winged helix-turn-helix transcriptional regulator n=1 Tax=Paraglaciecola sp. TaxID=1920173 RepID=UPI00273DFA96|nr:winged helix-turn-helix transcriptional regulator [Paraglaciecola sp.]MDP5031704.1 winged helix-turn-helix transcriptional regulator [Paraglaciecola sp.]
MKINLTYLLAAENLRKVATKINVNISEELKKFDFNFDQAVMIYELNIQEHITQTLLSKRVNLPKHTISRNLDFLENKLFVKRITDPSSRRSFQLELTEKGREIAPKLNSIIENVYFEILSPLDKSERVTLINLLSKIQ